MAEKLIIVESPTKVHTIKKFLGSGYNVVASQGHIRDLPKSKLGVDIDNDFEPQYITIRGKGEVIAELKKAIKKADKIYLATDPDREGEAISWHLTQGFDMGGKEVSRITFNEITKDAVKAALKKPHAIDENLVNAQQARRVLDRVVGYELSPILWKKVKGKLSAGRVQSAVLSMVAAREKEINAFVPEEYWSICAVLDPAGKKSVTADFFGRNGRRMTVASEEEAKKIEDAVTGKVFTVSELQKSTRAKMPPLPFTTSTLQQEASIKLNFSTSKTMRTAQALYEGVKVTGRGTVGLITYLRTDSTRIADEADAACRAYISEKYGAGHVGKGAVKNTNGAQDAHEAIRPADVTLSPELLKNDLSRDELRLYTLIWKRFVSSRMKPAVFDTAAARFDCADYQFTSATSKLAFPGYMLVYGNDEDKVSGDQGILDLTENETLNCSGLTKEQHFTKPPAHYTEATLVRAMEEAGLGRPSTYAPTITNILGRHYIAKEGRNLFLTELGDAVNTMLEGSFPDIVDLGFTAEMEKKLDDVAEGREDWHQMMKDFYPNFEQEVRKAEKELEHVRVADEISDVPCDKCGRMMVIKYGPHGKFLACPGFPECRNTKPFIERAGIACPKCGKDLVVRRTKTGRRFYACEDAECGYMSWTKPREA